MSFTPITGSPPQYQKSDGTLASGYYVKTYVAGTTTPLSMATDSTGGTTLAKAQINTAGYPVNGSGDVFIPHVSQSYKIVLYKNATDADNDTTGNADWVVDNITQSAAATPTQTIEIEKKLGSDAVGQVFTLTSIVYTLGVNNLAVYRNGIRLIQGVSNDYEETSATSITVNSNITIADSDNWLFVIGESTTSTVSDAASVTYTPAGSGAVATNVQAKLRESPVSVLDFGAVADFDDSDPTGTTGTDCYQAFVDALATGKDVYVPRGSYRITQTLSITTDGQNIIGDGWFSSRLYYTETEVTNALISTENENIGLRFIGLFNGVNVALPENRTNIGLVQTSNGNLGLQQVYATGFGYGFQINNFFAHRIVVENTKQSAIWIKNGRKSVLHNATMAGNRQSLRLGNGTNNENLSEMSFANMVLEHGAPISTWASDLVPCIRIEGKAYKTTWSNIHIKTPFGPAIEIDNEYLDGATPTPSESGHYFVNVDITNNRTMSSATDAIDITKSKHVHFTNLSTRQPITSGQGWDKAITVNDTDSFCRVSNSYIGGTNESIGSDSLSGNTNQISLYNTLYNKGGTIYECGVTREDGHWQDEGNTTGTKNLTIGESRSIKFTLTGATTLSTIVNNATDGDRIRLMFIQDGTGSHSLSFNAAKWVTSISASSGTANQYLTVEFQYYGSVSKFIQIGAPSAWMT